MERPLYFWSTWKYRDDRGTNLECVPSNCEYFFMLEDSLETLRWKVHVNIILWNRRMEFDLIFTDYLQHDAIVQSYFGFPSECLNLLWLPVRKVGYHQVLIPRSWFSCSLCPLCFYLQNKLPETLLYIHFMGLLFSSIKLSDITKT